MRFRHSQLLLPKIENPESGDSKRSRKINKTKHVLHKPGMKISLSFIAAVVSIVGTLLFLFNLLPGVVRIYQGEIANGTKIIVNATSDEIISVTYHSIVVSVLIAIFSALGFTSIVALLKKL